MSLTDWSGPLVATVPAASSGTSTSYQLSASAALVRFYRISLLP
jgi:hypothetical protein